MPTPRETLIATILSELPPELHREFHQAVADKLKYFLTWAHLEIPLPDGPRFMCWLTRAEWQLCYSLSLALQIDGELNPDLETDEAFRAMIVMLEHEHGFRFNGLSSDEDGRLFVRELQATCEENILFVQMLRRGIAPDYLAHCAGALALAESHDALTFAVDILEDLRDKLESDSSIAKSIPMRSDVRGMILENMAEGTVH